MAGTTTLPTAAGAPPAPAAAPGGFALHLALGLWGLSSWILFNGTCWGSWGWLWWRAAWWTRRIARSLTSPLPQHALLSPGLWGQLPLFVRTLPEVREQGLGGSIA